ncbi:hypothetical protein [Arsenicicoccus dermatophilus]|uniref:hypothetical protein n=1 Tax=Arsenicicoccus dermatophilus TaxID=1076331 RepID=UPI001F4CDCBD|nr:hypothetical protein [Arsenicicoccus dermatophilus]MCH8612013.1 hypothetical protein [Arsenicicoccus dermatophilus]
MARKTQPLPDTDDGHARRIVLADERTRKVLGSHLAQAEAAISMGMRIALRMRSDGTSAFIHELEGVDEERLKYVATLIRPFTGTAVVLVDGGGVVFQAA